MDVKINKEIRDYSESMFFGLSLRQFVFSVLACGIAVLIYFRLEPLLGLETTSWICIVAAFPFALAFRMARSCVRNISLRERRNLIDLFPRKGLGSRAAAPFIILSPPMSRTRSTTRASEPSEAAAFTASVYAVVCTFSVGSSAPPSQRYSLL